MNKFVKTLLALSIASASVFSPANAASYTVIDKGSVDTHKYTFAIQENNLGEMVISGTKAFNIPIDFSDFTDNDYLSIRSIAASSHTTTFEADDIENVELLTAGTPTNNDLFWVKAYLSTKAGQDTYQQIRDIAALLNLNSQTEELVIFDQFAEGTTQLTRSTTDDINGITDRGWVYGSGSAPYLPIIHTQDGIDTKYYVRDFISRGFYSRDRGQTIIPLVPPEATYGGISQIADLNENGIAVGYASTRIADFFSEFIQSADDNCSDPEVLVNIPLPICINRVLTANGVTPQSIYSTEAFKWQIQDDDTITAESLGHLITPHVDDTRELQNYAQAVNDNGVVVGHAEGWYFNNVTEPNANSTKSTYAVVYKNGKAFDFNKDHEKFYDSRSTDINNQGIAVGYTKTFLAGSLRNTFFYVDTNDVDNMEMVMPKAFFTGAASTARAINENGIIVGQSEVETHNTQSGGVRRTHGFMYDITTEKLTNLNDLLSCNSAYTIIDSSGINEQNEITATALVKQPSKDASGNAILNSKGDIQYEDVVRAVKMQPTNGEIEDCSEVEEKIERQGASIGLFSFLLLVVIGLRRRV